MHFCHIYRAHQKAANKVNKKAVLTTKTDDICQRVVVRWQKTLVFCVTFKLLIISEINAFNADNKWNQFQEPPFLDPKTAASCRWNRPFQAKEPQLSERKSMEWGCFQLLSVLKDEILCNVDFANHHPWFSISQKNTTVNFLYPKSVIRVLD